MERPTSAIPIAWPKFLRVGQQGLDLLTNGGISSFGNGRSITDALIGVGIFDFQIAFLQAATIAMNGWYLEANAIGGIDGLGIVVVIGDGSWMTLGKGVSTGCWDVAFSIGQGAAGVDGGSRRRQGGNGKGRSASRENNT